ncbi:hypothetical protein [Natrarchaeobaculum aegyptiacum]|uniref:Uncharacterized protein n=1 Tax=Natrarchaeobaculum aegyptiacum TaxID=745377 RepID=A0A2Z2HX64_9EURY|nr:hypothetical protein [Natrarchaeobaculum aegyptiacum]ARS90775.1 hypothetical protein B1756_14280 [Natrarchaeobaculum aegyptiacum]
MKGKIIDEDEMGLGVRVTDNNGVSHTVAVGFDGEIQGHSQDGYPDKAAKRSDEGNEHVEQARRFAQYYVYCERGYDTVPPEIHPERLNAVRVAIASLPPEEFEQYCGDLYQQLRSYDDPDVDRVIDVPVAAKDTDSVLYRKQLYLGLDPRETEFDDVAAAIASRHGLELSTDSLEDASLEDDADLAGWRDVAQELGALADEADADLSPGLEIAGASPLHMTYIDGRGEEHVTDPDAPFDRDPDALLELPVMDVESLAQFQEYVNHNLACQIRDCYVRMGLEPPRPFRVLGYGRFEAAEQYNRLEMYPNYIDPEEQRAFA